MTDRGKEKGRCGRARETAWRAKIEKVSVRPFTILGQIDEAPEAVLPVANIRSESTLEGGHGQQQ
jgi:hypothetical protein